MSGESANHVRELRAYYGKGACAPKTAGGFALQVWTDGEGAYELEMSVFRWRKDIGRVDEWFRGDAGHVKTHDLDAERLADASESRSKPAGPRPKGSVRSTRARCAKRIRPESRTRP